MWIFKHIFWAKMEISGAGGLFSTYSICSNAAGIAGKYFFLLFLDQVRLIWIHDI